MQLRVAERWAIVAAAIAGGVSSPGAFSGDVARMLTIFLGLVSASILPTVTLLINSMTHSGRSIKAVDELGAELEAAMDVMFLLLGSVGVVVLGLVALQVQPITILTKVRFLTTDILPRSGQALVLGTAALILLRVGSIPGILRKMLGIKYQIARSEATQTTEDNAPSITAVRDAFKTHPEFGKSVNLSDIKH